MAQTLVATLVVWMLLALLCVLVLIVIANWLHPYPGNGLRAGTTPGGDDRSYSSSRLALGAVARAPDRRWAATRSSPTSRCLIVVSRTHPTLHEALSRVFGEDASTEMVVDRRIQQRRSLRIWTSTERRRADRRQHQVDDDLRTTGWALVQLRT